MFSGELAALSAALMWTASSVVYKGVGQKIPPLQLNLLKGGMAIIFLALTLLLQQQLLPDTKPLFLILLLLSGAIGIGLGDTAFFYTLNHLGVRRTLLLETLAPPLTAILSLFFLGEKLSNNAWLGIFLTILGVAWVISEQTDGSVISKRDFLRGVIWGLLAELAQANGAILSRAALVASDIDPLWSTLLRLVAGTSIAFFLLLFRKSTADTAPQISWSPQLLSKIAIAAFGGTYLGIWLQQTALKLSPAGIAQTLSSTSPLFALPISASLGEKISLRAIVGALISVGGIAILFGLT